MKYDSGSITGAVFCEPAYEGAPLTHRYSLWRRWEDCEPNRMACFIGLNPSTADWKKNDPTVRRCIQFAKEFGYSGMYMMNLFGFRATNPKEMVRIKDPVGDKNDEAIMEIASAAGIVIGCWGSLGLHRMRYFKVTKMLVEADIAIHALSTTSKHYLPRHPLYLSAKCRPFLWANKETFFEGLRNGPIHSTENNG